MWCVGAGCAYDQAPFEGRDADELDVSVYDVGVGDLDQGRDFSLDEGEPSEDLLGDDGSLDVVEDVLGDVLEDILEDIVEDDGSSEPLVFDDFWTGARCLEHCVYRQSCVGEICDLGVLDPEGIQEGACVAACMSSASFREELWRGFRTDCTHAARVYCEDEAISGHVACDCSLVPSISDKVGEGCATDAECVTSSWSGVCRVDTLGGASFPGGYCSSISCSSSFECGEGNWCATLDGVSACVKGCSPAGGLDGCREGYACWPQASWNRVGVCLAACTEGSCGEGMSYHLGACVEPRSCEGNRVCLADLLCVEGVCLSP